LFNLLRKTGRILMIVIFVTLLGNVGITFLYVLLGVYSGTGVTFQSSDGLWGDHEGFNRKFHLIVVRFEKYKIGCNVPDVTLQRITVKPEGFSIRGLFNDYSEPKWLVPLAHNLQPQARAFEPRCAVNNVSDWKLANDRADAYINQLLERNQ